MTVQRYTASRYASLSHRDDGSLMLHSPKTGAIGVVEPDLAERARKALMRDTVTVGPLAGVEADLLEAGLLIPEDHDESIDDLERFISRYSSKSLELIVLPTEQCNFRCVYCYEEFLRKSMAPDLQDAIVSLVQGQAPSIDRFTLSWFGGEPLVAVDVVVNVTEQTKAICEHAGVPFGCAMTTNGSLLTPQTADRILSAGVTDFQITLDGTAEEHDRRRIGKDGEKTFDTIISNLRDLKQQKSTFRVLLRHNFDPESQAHLDSFLDMLAGEFANDERFIVNFEAIGRWGGPNDDKLDIFEGRDAAVAITDARRRAIDRGLDAASLLLDGLQPDSYVCYAADPRSYVIGPEGDVYKCTVELDYHERNKVGRLLPDGTLDVDWRKIALWCETNGMEAGKKCNTCWFEPSCHGAICPKDWLDENDCNCPAVKHTIRDTLQLVGDHGAPADAEPLPRCSR